MRGGIAKNGGKAADFFKKDTNRAFFEQKQTLRALMFRESGIEGEVGGLVAPPPTGWGGQPHPLERVLGLPIKLCPTLDCVQTSWTKTQSLVVHF